MSSAKKIILASGSPRRHELLSSLGFNFEIRLKEIEEDYSHNIKAEEVAEYLANLKADAYLPEIQEDELLITADTVVIFENKILGKPQNATDAFEMLKKLSNNQHKVASGVAILTKNKRESFTETTNVYFDLIKEDEITHYIEKYQPLDKAGAYGIQEWIGLIGVSKIEGSYHNVMGLPTQQLYKRLIKF